MFNIFKYLEEVRQEARRISWPNKNEVFQISIFVLILVLVLSLFFFSVDIVLSYLHNWFFG